MTDELHAHLRNIIEDAIERAEDHLDWLAHHPNEPDALGQCASTLCIIFETKPENYRQLAENEDPLRAIYSGRHCSFGCGASAVKACWATSVVGQERPFSDVRVTSVHPSISDIILKRRECRNGPLAEVGRLIRLPRRRSRAATLVRRGRASWRS
jgi:hypothetical protein